MSKSISNRNEQYEINLSDRLAYKHFCFPLNVYALMLQLETGVVDSLHYGLFKHADESFAVAQFRASTFLFSHLPDSPCRIIDVGCGLGTTFQHLERLGYQVAGINPDKHQVAMARQQLGSAADLTVVGLENLDDRHGQFDLVLFQESAQYVNVLDMFEKSFDLLDKHGEILIMDEFCIHPDKVEKARLPLLSNVLSMAKRYGFELMKHEDLSSQAVHTLDCVYALIDKHRDTLNRMLELENNVLSDIQLINRSYKARYDAGEDGYAMLKFQKSKKPRWQVGLARQDHFDDIAALFKSVFHEIMTPELWHWKYGQARGEAVLAWKGNQLAAHYGGMGRDILFFGTPCMACQNVDVMVVASERGAITRKGPFFLTCATYLELFIGYGKKYLIGYGFPNRRAMQVAEKLGLYGEVDSMSEVRWDTGKKWQKLRTRIRHINSLSDQTVVQLLWRQMSDDLKDSIVGVRDWSYIQHRYLNHPEKSYQVLLVSDRFGGGSRGLIVLKCLQHECELMDVVGSVKNISLLIDQARRMACRWGKKSLFCWVTSHMSSIFNQSGGVISDLDISIPCNVWSDGPGKQELSGRWWLMSGDTDFR